MADEWFANVLVLTVQLNDFRGVIDGARFGGHKFF
jgi:hypothetical protein